MTRPDRQTSALRRCRAAGPPLFVVLGAILVLSSTGAAIDGQRLYLDQCRACHGPSGRGDGPDASLFSNRPPDLQRNFVHKYPTDELVRRVREGRALELALDLPKLRARATDVEAVAGYLRRLPEIDWRRADAGAGIYAARCEACHGRFGQPPAAMPAGVRPPRDLADPAFQGRLSDAEMMAAVRHGRDGMPALVPRLRDDEARDATAYVRLFSPGFETYAQYCASCHGDHGDGSGSVAEERPAPTVVFDRAYFDRRDPEALRGRIWHMLAQYQPAMPHFRDLSDAQVRAILAWLRSQAQPAR